MPAFTEREILHLKKQGFSDKQINDLQDRGVIVGGDQPVELVEAKIVAPSADEPAKPTPEIKAPQLESVARIGQRAKDVTPMTPETTTPTMENAPKRVRSSELRLLTEIRDLLRAGVKQDQEQYIREEEEQDRERNDTRPQPLAKMPGPIGMFGREAKDEILQAFKASMDKDLLGKGMRLLLDLTLYAGMLKKVVPFLARIAGLGRLLGIGTAAAEGAGLAAAGEVAVGAAAGAAGVGLGAAALGVGAGVAAGGYVGEKFLMPMAQKASPTNMWANAYKRSVDTAAKGFAWLGKKTGVFEADAKVGHPFGNQTNITNNQTSITPAGQGATDVSPQGLQNLAQHEGFRAKPYHDGDGLSIGYGSHKTFLGAPITKNMVVTKEQAAEDVRQRLHVGDDKHPAIIPAIQRDLKVPVSQELFDALVSLAWNLGSIPKALMDKINAGTMNKGDWTQYAKAPKIANSTTRQRVEETLRIRREQEYNSFAKPPSPTTTSGLQGTTVRSRPTVQFSPSTLRQAQPVAGGSSGGTNQTIIVPITQPAAPMSTSQSGVIIPYPILPKNDNPTLAAIRHMSSL